MTKAQIRALALEEAARLVEARFPERVQRRHVTNALRSLAEKTRAT